MTQSATKAIHAATNWFVQLTSGEATEQDHQAWKDWLNADPEHKRAWQEVESITNRFMGLDAKTSVAVLTRSVKKRDISPTSMGRRQAIKNLGLLFAVGSTSWYTFKEKPWYALFADYSTGVGEIQHVTLEDDTRLVLNTDTKVSIHFDEQTRNLKLLQGEIYVETAYEDNRVYRPFIANTEHGTVKALGTRFSTRITHKGSCVNVFEDAVEVRPIKSDGETLVVNAGETVKFTTNRLQQKMPFDSAANAWTKGFIIVDKMPLGEFVTELSRYRIGVLRCDPDIAHLEISGAFPVNDIDAALISISRILPIRVENFTRYWTMLKSA